MHTVYCNNIVKQEAQWHSVRLRFADEDDIENEDADSTEYSVEGIPFKRICQQTAVAESAMGHYLQIVVPKENLPSSSRYHIGMAQKWLTLPGKNGKIHKFPVQTMLPKVQMRIHVPEKSLPRDVEVDRRRRQYTKINLQEMLQNVNITNEELLPTEEQYGIISETAFKHFLPLYLFDNFDYACHSPDKWMSLGIVGDEKYPLPAKAFLPVDLSLKEYRWQYAAVITYTRDLVHEGMGKYTVFSLKDENYFKIPKIQIMCLAEDPRIFVERVQHAVNERNKAELLITMETIVDCVLLQDLKEKRFYPQKRIDNLLKKLNNGNLAFMTALKNEVYLVFERLMAYYEFEKFVILLPEEFPAFGGDLIKNALPKKLAAPLSEKERKMIKNLKLNMKNIRYQVLKTTLYYIAAGIEAMENVAVACQYIETINLFVCTFSKPMPLNDFLLAQESNSKKIARYLQSFWPEKISAGISLVLRALGKGWLDITLNKWDVYEMCKIIRFMLQVKFRMQESMQVLLEKSIGNFTKYLSEPCQQFLKLTPDFKWTSNFIVSEFPYEKPIFSLLISVSDDGKVMYSTPPEDFEPNITQVFKKSLEKTSAVRCIEAETLINLKFAPNLYILTVELIEDVYIVSNSLLKRSYIQAVIPLLAYAKQYERFIQFYLLKVNDFMNDFEASQRSSIQVKHVILEHKRQKEELREILPAFITIGPFYINVDVMKNYMIRKHIEIIRRLFEYYVQRMLNINERLLEKCVQTFNSIAVRPTSIEHLYEIRDFALTVPTVVDGLKSDIQIMFLEYEMLDSFFYNLSDFQFAMKWEVYAWPHNIMHRLSTLREEQKINIEDFRRMHFSECLLFEESLEALNEEVQAFSLIFNPDKVIETAVDVKKTWNGVMKLQQVGNTLKYRQQLFEEEELSLEFLNSIVEGFIPYQNLWLTCFDFIKLEEATTGNPIIGVELEEVGSAMEVIRASLEKSYKIFHEKPEIQDVATIYLEKLDQFVPVHDCIKWLRNENWLILHWQELASRSGMEIKYTSAMNFRYLIRKGVMDHLELVREISDKVDIEADIIRKAHEEKERLKKEAHELLILRKSKRKCRTDIL